MTSNISHFDVSTAYFSPWVSEHFQKNNINISYNLSNVSIKDISMLLMHFKF